MSAIISEIRWIIIIIACVIGAGTAKKNNKSVILGAIIGGVVATILVELVWGVLRGLGY